MAARNRRALARTLIVVALLCVAIGWQPGSIGGPRATTAQALIRTTCATSTEPYSMEVCLTAPDVEVPLEEDALIQASATVEDRDVRVLSVDFAIDERRVLSDFDVPYEFVLPVSIWEAGTHELSVSARMSDKERSTPVTTQITIAEGLEPPVPAPPFSPHAGRAPGPGESYVVAAIGDSAGGSPESMAVADLIGSWNPNLVLYLGDVYNFGTYTEFMNWYDPDAFIGRFRDITLPTPGNHEYSGADTPQGYMQYWGDPPHYYSVEAAGWQVISLDSNTRFGELTSGSPQLTWLDAELASSTSSCKLVFFHHPPFSVGTYAEEAIEMREVWEVLTSHDVTLVLTGHDHNYQRWERLDANGERHPAGTVSAVVGTGGQSFYAAQDTGDKRVAGPVIGDPGALRLELNPNGAALQFATVDGIVRDADVVPCDQSMADESPPSPPQDVVAVTEADGSVAIRWDHAIDETGVSHYAVYRDDVLIADGVIGNAYVAGSASSGASYSVVAVDDAGNRSPATSASIANDRPPDDGVLFADTFSSGSLVRWERVRGLAIEPAADAPGWVARARGSTHAAWASWTLPVQEPETLSVNIQFRILSQGENPIVFLRLRSPDGDSLLSVSVGQSGTLGIFNNVIGAGANSDQEVSGSDWHELEVVSQRDADGRSILVLLDNTVVEELSGPVDLGPTGIAGIQMGDSTAGRVYDVQYSTVTIGTDAPILPATPDAATPDAATPDAATPVSLTELPPASLFGSAGLASAAMAGTPQRQPGPTGPDPPLP